MNTKRMNDVEKCIKIFENFLNKGGVITFISDGFEVNKTTTNIGVFVGDDDFISTFFTRKEIDNMIKEFNDRKNIDPIYGTAYVLEKYQKWCNLHPEHDQVCETPKVELYLKTLSNGKDKG